MQSSATGDLPLIEEEEGTDKVAHRGQGARS